MLRTGTLLFLVAGATACVAQERQEWRAIYLDGEQVGYERTRYRVDAETLIARRQTRLDSRSLKADLEVTIRSDTGGIVQLYERRLGRHKSVTTIGEAQGGMRPAGTAENGRTTWRQVSDDARSPLWFEYQLLNHPMPPRNRMRIKTLETDREEDLTITSTNWRKVTLPNGKRRRLLPLKVTRTQRPGEVQYLHMNDKGQIELAEFHYRGVKMLTQLMPRSEAQTPEDAKVFDIQLAGFVPANRALPGGRETEEAVYLMSGPGRLDQTLNHTPRQLTKAATDGAVELTVVATKLDGGQHHLRVDPEYLRSTKLIDHRNTNVQRFAAEAAAGEFATDEVAKKLQRAVGVLVRNRSFSTDTLPASEILQTKTGDCTEHAVLLAAALRARRIPSRICVGLIYIDGKNCFGAHMWTEAMINARWTALDATFARKKDSKQGARIPGAGYIKVAHSSLPDGEAVLDTFLPLADMMSELSIEIVPSK